MKPETLVIETSHGPVRGIKRTSAVGDQFFSFRGIPYAKPPIGELRFKVTIFVMNFNYWQKLQTNFFC